MPATARSSRRLRAMGGAALAGRARTVATSPSLRAHALVISMVLAAWFLARAGAAPAIDLAPPVDAAPVFISAWGTQGSGHGQFNLPNGVAADGNGHAYVADTMNHRIQLFTANGGFLTTWGQYGSGDGEFNAPYGIAVSGDGAVYVSDYANHRIQKFDADGDYLTQWGSQGTAHGQFNYPYGLAVSGDGHVYVADTWNNRMQEFLADGTFVRAWGSQGTGDGEFNYPHWVAVDSDGNVYVTEPSRNQLQKFTATGTFVTKWGSEGTGDGQFEAPVGIAIDGDDTVYVDDLANHRVQQFTSTGTFLAAWTTPGSGGGGGAGDSLAVDADGRVYVTDAEHHRILTFGHPRPDGRIKLGSTGTLKGDDVYNTTGTGQTRTGSAARGGTVTYVVSVQNDAAFPDTLRLRGTASTSRFRIKYSANGTGITNAVVGGTYTTPVLAPGATHVVKVQVTVLAAAPMGASLRGTLVTKSDSDTSLKDTVAFTTSRR